MRIFQEIGTNFEENEKLNFFVERNLEKKIEFELKDMVK